MINEILISIFIILFIILLTMIIYKNLYEKKVNNRNFLVFTSAGNNSINFIKPWFKSNRNYDIAIAWYGTDEDVRKELSKICDYMIDIKGGKFPNFKYFYYNNLNIINNYKGFWIVDDDISLESHKISKLFETLIKENLYILSPSFNTNGKISHKINIKNNRFLDPVKMSGEKVKYNKCIRYTNFIEMTCPFFSNDIIHIVIKDFPNILVGWGGDWYFLNIVYDYMNIQRGSKNDKIAIDDCIDIINPHDNDKIDGIREIHRLSNDETRKKIWGIIMNNKNYETWEHLNF